jgi:ubiquinone/menaquinone biosynthesis C-methylase UbiE
MPQTNERLENERRHFDGLADRLGNVWWGHLTQAGRLRIERRCREAVRFAGLREGVSVLEPGAGAGEFTEQLARSGASISAVELSPGQVKLAREKMARFPNVTLIVGDAGALDFPDCRFDAVVGLSVLHHLDLGRVLLEFFRVLKPGGRMFFSEPNMLNPQVFLERNVKWLGRRLQNSPDETAFYRWPLARQLRAVGFSEVRVEPVDFLHPAIPGCAVGLMNRVNHLLERIPLLRELAGSHFIYAAKPEPSNAPGRSD